MRPGTGVLMGFGSRTLGMEEATMTLVGLKFVRPFITEIDGGRR